MKTNFFENIAGLNAPGIWKIGIQNDENGRFVVSALYAPTENNDPALKTIAPLIFKGTATEMDEGFFEAIEKPVQETAGLYSNLDAYRKSLEGAKKKLAQNNKSQPAKVKSEGDEDNEDDLEVTEPKVSAEEKKRIYTEAIRKVVLLNDACKYAEALEILPSVTDYPEKAEELNKRKTDLTRKKEQMDKALQLFNQD
ncbi:PRTRC system protein E [Mucilaginibacter sp. BJC16-A38]|uniref:PRTRC system protein E n=1 Tax=Mucilaginibacter phenanthrenivorans TaxID=1234842 RepID=UPI002157B616|nr:PRTRC system protein E [Mucilaginibacter phenanthrenivorans]MCR8560320.1 PRTRC system protein E [Mucilaginibacter phenanthrenivorans]